MNRETNPFWLQLQAQLDEQFQRMEKPQAVEPYSGNEPDPAQVKRARLEIQRMKRRNLERAA